MSETADLGLRRPRMALGLALSALLWSAALLLCFGGYLLPIDPSGLSLGAFTVLVLLPLLGLGASIGLAVQFGPQARHLRLPVGAAGFACVVLLLVAVAWRFSGFASK